MPEEERDCVLCFDEMSLHQARNFDKSTNKYIGHCSIPPSNHNAANQSGNELPLASKVMVFMLGGVRKKWKQVVAYHFTGLSYDPNFVADIVSMLIAEVFKIGLKVKVLVCDMGYRRVMSLLGAVMGPYGMTVSVPHPIPALGKLYIMPGVLHVLKNFRAMLMKNRVLNLDLRTVAGNNLPSAEVKADHLDELVRYQMDMEWKLAPSLRASDLRSSHFDKMKVGPARRIVNGQTSAAVEYLAEQPEGEASMKTTAWLLRLMSDWFQYMTSRHYAFALSKRNVDPYRKAIRTLEQTKEVFAGMAVPGGWKPVQTGVIACTTAVLEFSDHYLEEKGAAYLLAGRLNQDKAENLFSRMRLRRSVPTPLECKETLRSITVVQVATPLPR